jgi:hypothetical protein
LQRGIYTTSRGYWGKEQVILIPQEQKEDAENVTVLREGPKKRITVFMIPSEPLLKAHLYRLLSFIRPSPDPVEDREIKEIRALIEEKHHKCYSEFFELAGNGV